MRNNYVTKKEEKDFFFQYFIIFCLQQWFQLSNMLTSTLYIKQHHLKSTWHTIARK